MVFLKRVATLAVLIALILLPLKVVAHEYREDFVPWNINDNKDAGIDVLQYSTSMRPKSGYTPSPTNWRELPFYTLLLDKFADGDPTNNDFFNTTFEHDVNELNFRFGGDVRGLQRHLDYLQGMGIRGVYVAGTPFLNMPWQADSKLFAFQSKCICDLCMQVIRHSIFPSSIHIGEQ